MKQQKRPGKMRGISICVLFVILLLPSMQGALIIQNTIEKFIPPMPSDQLTNEVEYWALLIAVGIYKDNPPMDRPTMIREIQRFEEMFTFTENWQSDHIKTITKEDATVLSIWEGFRWLDEMEDEDDVCLIYLTTHGFPLWFDRPPFDERDGRDEALASYTGFFPFEPIDPDRWEPMTNPFGIVTDDQINRWLNRLESSAVGVIVDSCHSGGFNDYWSYSYELDEPFMMGLAGEISGQGRVVVTSVPEEDVSYGSRFSHNLIDGFYGHADTNHDDLVTLEEAFVYAEEIVEDQTGMDPQIFDYYSGDLILIELP